MLPHAAPVCDANARTIARTIIVRDAERVALADTISDTVADARAYDAAAADTTTDLCL